MGMNSKATTLEFFKGNRGIWYDKVTCEVCNECY